MKRIYHFSAGNKPENINFSMHTRTLKKKKEFKKKEKTLLKRRNNKIHSNRAKFMPAAHERCPF